MCRNIKMLFNFDPPVTDEEIRAASLQFVRKVSGFNKPSKSNEAAFQAAVDEIAAVSARLLSSLETNAPPRSREEEAARAKARNAARFGVANDVLAAGEGIETMLSLRCVLPTLPMAAALSANHLAAMLLPLTLRRLYIARDADAAGDAAVTALTGRANAAGIEAIAWSPRLGDFNEDLRTFGIDDLRAALRTQLAPQDVVRFMLWATAETG